jgi:hypothetical protein
MYFSLFIIYDIANKRSHAMRLTFSNNDFLQTVIKMFKLFQNVVV